MKQFAPAVLAIVAGLGIGAPELSAQRQTVEALPSFKSALDLVTIQASVRDRRGRPIGGLTAADFDVLDNGHQTPVVSLSFDRDAPVSLAVLVDMSGSMRLGEKVDMARHAFDSVLAQLQEGRDEVAVFTFDSALHERRGFTTDLRQAGDALDEFEPFGTTSLYDAAAATARRLSDRSATHKAIVVLTDGLDTTSRLSAREVSDLASAIDVPVYVVATIPSVDQRALLQSTARATAASATADLRDLADWTGGQFSFASTTVETLAAVTQVIVELRQQYVLSIEAGAAAEWRKLDVRVRRPAALVRARSGYFGG